MPCMTYSKAFYVKINRLTHSLTLVCCYISLLSSPNTYCDLAILIICTNKGATSSVPSRP